MYIRKLRNRSGSVSVQVIQKVRGRYKVVKTIGCATEQHVIEQLESQARGVIEELSCQRRLFGFDTDQAVEDAFSALANASIRTVGPELIFGRIYDKIGFGVIGEPLFRHLVIARLAFPLSKLKTCEYLYRYVDYARYDLFTKEGVYYVTRLKDNAVYLYFVRSIIDILSYYI